MEKHTPIPLVIHQVPTDQAAERLIPYLLNTFPHFPSKKGLIKALKRGEIRVNGQWVGKNHRITAGDTIHHYASQQTPPKVYPRKLEILFEDDYLAVIRKPAGIPVNGNTYQCVENALRYNLTESKEPDVLPWPRPVHRLDRDTTGVLLVAKTAKASVELGKQFQERSIKKTYEALAIGSVPTKGTWASPIDGKEAHTDFQLLEQVPSLHGEWLSWVRLFPQTGRTHQLRIHLSEAGFPILGDKLYGKPGLIFRGKGMFLCATGIRCVHPVHQHLIAIHSAPPNKFGIHLRRSHERWNKFH